MKRNYLMIGVAVAVVALAALATSARVPTLSPVPPSGVFDTSTIWCTECNQREHVAYIISPTEPNCVEVIWYVDNNGNGSFDRTDTIEHGGNSCRGGQSPLRP